MLFRSPRASSAGRPSGDAKAGIRWRSVLRWETAVQASVIIALLAAWQLSSQFGWANSFLLPPPAAVLARIGRHIASGTLFVDVGVTLYRTVAGFALAAAIGVPLGVLMGRLPRVRWFFEPIVSVGFPMPKIAFLPIMVLWFDIYDTSKILMIAFSCIFPMITSAFLATVSIDKWQIWSARSFGVSETTILRQVILPLASPQILTGLQIATPVALITAIVCEMMLGGAGLGGKMMIAGRFADSVGVFAGIVEIGLLGLAVMRLQIWLRGRLLRWHAEAPK